MYCSTYPEQPFPCFHLLFGTFLSLSVQTSYIHVATLERTFLSDAVETLNNSSALVVCCLQDMEYWGVDDLYLEPCCVQRYYQQRELLNWDHQVNSKIIQEMIKK